MNPKPTPRHTQDFWMIVMLFIIIMFGAALIAAFLLFWLPNQARNTFGPPAEGIKTEQQFFLSARLLLDQEKLLNPASNDETPITVIVNKNQNLGLLAEKLELANVIPDAEVFIKYLVYKGIDTTIQQGTFQINGSMTPIEIAYALQNPTPNKITTSMLAGWRIEEFANSIASYGVINAPEALIDIVQNPQNYNISTRLPIEQGMEGFLLPGEYQLERENLQLEGILYPMLLNFEASVDAAMQDQFAQQGLSLREAVILASIVQREAKLEGEMPYIASVFLNRLRIDMPLAADPTVQYALGYNADLNTWWKSPLSTDDLTIDSPYNTYLYGGLPPGPICNPSLEALRAVAQPAVTDYLYFRAACDDSGAHNFSTTYDEHLNYACP